MLGNEHEEKQLSQEFVVDMNKQSLDPAHPWRALLLLSSGRAALCR
jgi:hypothetical protein